MTLFYSPEEEADFKRQSMEFHFGSHFGFLNTHRGLRKGSVHLIIGNTSGGKSTLMRSLVRDILLYKDNKRTQLGLWLTEETIEEYKQQLSVGFPSSEELLRSEAFYEFSTLDVSEKTFISWLELSRPDILILDNITTSKFYMDKKPEVQACFILKLKELTKRFNFALVVVAHTDSTVNQSHRGYIELNQVRGSKQLSNMAEFAYILQRFQLKNDFFATIRIVKNRSQDIVHDLYLLCYDKKLRSYISDKALDHEKFKEAYESRIKL